MKLSGSPDLIGNQLWTELFIWRIVHTTGTMGSVATKHCDISLWTGHRNIHCSLIDEWTVCRLKWSKLTDRENSFLKVIQWSKVPSVKQLFFPERIMKTVFLRLLYYESIISLLLITWNHMTLLPKEAQKWRPEIPGNEAQVFQK